MLTQQLIATLILRSRAYRLLLTRQVSALEHSGDNDYNLWNKIVIISHLIDANLFSLFIADYISPAALAVYSNLTRCLGANILASVTINPNAQLPGNNIIIINDASTQNVQTQDIPFVNQTVVGLTGYQANYAANFGPRPFVAIFITNAGGTGNTEDKTTPPDTEYVDNDPSLGIDSITFTYPEPTSGFVRILGIKPS